MQRRVILMRHGHAEQAADDYSRPLSELGVAQARASGAALAREGWIPSEVLTSSAPRAQSTAECVAETCGYHGAVRAERALYLAPERLCLDALRKLSPDVESVLLVGHNPGLSGLAGLLFGRQGDLSPAEYVSEVFELESWSELE